jgi:hypothetical protein
MKPCLIPLALFLSSIAAFGQITIPSDGSDGAFNPPGSFSTTTIDLSLATVASYDTNNSGNAGKGVYDPVRHAVVFKYSAVTIPANATVQFINNSAHAPVVWLVQGNVSIAASSTVRLNGNNVSFTNVPAEPGPGGFRGGVDGSGGRGAGLGPAGSAFGGVASYASAYGNPSIVPLIGGSGGGGSGGGGGAILIAAAGTISVNGSITANGGTGNSGSGSGGAIRLVANTINGNGTLSALPDGRIRLEANSVSGSLSPQPQTVTVAPQVPPVIWPDANAPTVKITKVDTANVPTNPTASLDISADVGVSVNSSATVTIRTTNFVTAGGLVQVRSAGKFSSPALWTTATLQSGNDAQADWIATVPCPGGFSTLQARATRP